METPRKNKAVFLDRDGTINHDVHFCRRVEDFKLLPGVAEGIRLLQEHGFKIIVITNQSGIGRGYFTSETLDKIHDKMRNDLAKFGASIDGIYSCPHHPDVNCDCRKPKTKMIFDASRDLNIDIAQSYLLGDDERDIQTGIEAGCKKSIMINNDRLSDSEHGIFDSFYNAVKWLIAYEKHS